MKSNVIFFLGLSAAVIGLSMKILTSNNDFYQTMDLSGIWNVSLDPENEWIKKANKAAKTSGNIDLPGSLAEHGYGFKTSGSDYGILTPEYRYVGKAWFTKTIQIPKAWESKTVTLFLERVLWESTIFLDGAELSKQDGLGTPHVHKLGHITPGNHTLTIQVDNEMIHNIGDKGHAYGDYTQSIWNGIVGRIELKAVDPTHIKHIRTISHLESDQLEIDLAIHSKIATSAVLSIQITLPDATKNIIEYEKKIHLSQGENRSETLLDLRGKLEKWSEFNPVVYNLKIKLESGKYTDIKKTEFGYLQIGHNGTKILINDHPVFLRGNLDCVHFPLTGYPSVKIEDWEKIFRTYKDYGLNHARFHSWCPPEAAFKAANRMGIYLQAEASVWIDWWMTEDMVARGRPEMDTKGHPQGLGYAPARDSFVIAEMHRMIEHYGNHPSFTMFCIGNELGNSDFEVMERWVADLKENDPRRLYAVSTARTITDVDDYSATHYIKDVGRTRGLNGSHTDWDFEAVYSQMQIPIIAHEIGQWPVYPVWKETEKYSGVLKARNFEAFKVRAEKNGIIDQDEDLRKASGALNQIMYKYETESFLRTPSCAGVQLLSMQDYQGQGEALIGWLDAHWESKNITSPARFRQHFSSTVPLLRIGKFVWENTDTLKARVQVAHHGNRDIRSKVVYNILNEAGHTIHQGSFTSKIFEAGTLTDLGEISFPLNHITHAQKFILEVSLDKTNHKNRWNVWVYPTELAINRENIIFASQLDDQILKALEDGAKVLLDASSLGDDETSVKAGFYPLYWSLTFFPGQGKTNIGLLVDQNHQAFESFPTDFHSDWQWESISEKSRGFILNDLPANFKPIAQPVDDFHRNNKVGSIFELRCSKGKLLVCGYNLKDSSQLVSRQLKYSLMKYMNSAQFSPTHHVSKAWLKDRLIKVDPVSSVDLPPAFSNAVLYIHAAKKLKDKNLSLHWNPSHDSLIIGDPNQYVVLNDGIWRDDHGSAWHGKDMTLTIQCEKGMLGDLYVFFQDWDQQGRSGTLSFEGRKSILGNHSKEGTWIKLHVMREDSNDGKLIFRSKATSGPNLMISQVALLKE